MAFMAPAPDQGALYNGGGLARSMSIPARGRGMAMESMGDVGSLASLEKLMEGGGVGAGAFTARSATTSPTGSGYWGQDMVAMLGGAQAGGAAELLGGSAMVSSDWQALLDAKSAPYKYLPPVSMAPALRHGGVTMENARVREMLAGKSTGKAWSAMEMAGGITVDPSKGGLALQGVGLATSHCLAQFTSDPAFAERAAKFSSFGSMGKYPQIALPLPVSDKPRSRSAESSGRLSRTSSNAKKLAAAAAAEMEDKQAASAAAAHAAAATTQAAAAAGAAAAERSSCDVDMDVDGVSISDDKSPPGAAPAQPELEAIEGASLATMDHSTHEVDTPAAQEPTNSCSAEQQQQQRGGASGLSPAASPMRSPSASDDSDRRKRKKSPAAADKPHADPKAADVVDSKPKRWKGERAEDDAAKAKAERSCSDNSGDSGSPRAHKDGHKHPKDLSKQDYIHVRARRGQATDSHSLAERVRREKISERMKYLQDLVPGCSKVTGKAVMLDEIINYVQSLQRQVENLSMKLASVNPGPAAARLDYGFESALIKETLQSRLGGGSSLGAPESSATFGMLQHQQQQQQQQQHHINSLGSHCGLDFRSMGGSNSGMDGFLRRSNSAPIHVASALTSVDTFGDDVSPSIGWDGELQSIVNQMGFGGHQGRFGSSILDGLHSQLPVGHMKVEM